MTDQYANPPQGYGTITPYLIVKKASEAIKFYKNVFEAKEVMRFDMPNGQVAHAELQIENSRFMLSDENPKFNALSPETVGGSASGLHLYVKDVDVLFKKAVDAGAKPIREPEDQFYGDRSASVMDPWGHHWSMATRKENLSIEEMHQRMAQLT